MSGDGGLQPRTIVVVPGCRLGEIMNRATRGRARGYAVAGYDDPDTTRGYLPHFMDFGSVRPAVVGVNVCPRPRGQCTCALVHATARVLAGLPAKEL
jgi:hypothetical protein